MVNFKEDEQLNMLNHSCAHLMAQAVKHLYPQAKFWVGPVVAEGFYYDIDPKNNGIKVHRKGGSEVMVYFGDEVAEALDAYLDERLEMEPQEGSTEAVFLSMQNRRINVRSVENLVKKYSRLVTTVKNITPHKLRSTYGTTLYQETGDIYLVADVLGHKDVNTTKKHYAAQADSRRRMAARAVQLREKPVNTEEEGIPQTKS